MNYAIVVMMVLVSLASCTGITSPEAEEVKLYEAQSEVPAKCELLGEVTASVCANTTPCPAEVMKKELRENAKKMNRELSKMRISMPILAQAMQPFVLQEILKMQDQYMKELEKMSPEDRKKFEEQMKQQMKK